MTGKRIIIELDEMDSCDSCAVDEAIEKVRYLISTVLTSGDNPRWRIENMETEED